MSAIAPTFDESWHRVAPRRVRLRPGVEIFAQRFRGNRWYVVRDSLSGKFFRVRSEAYRFICGLERSDSIGEAWTRQLECDPENAPGQGEVVRLLSSLHRAGLLRSDVEGDVEPLAEAFAKERRNEAMQRWSSILFFKMPLWNPDAFLRLTLPLAAWLFSLPGALLWLALLIWGGSEVVSHWTAFTADGAGLLGTANLPWMYAVMVVIKVVHEFGHGWSCRKFGGEVPEMGVMLLLFNPLPYVDASASTAFRSKWRRIAVGGAGMMVELALAAVAAIVWSHTGKGMVHGVAYNAIISASMVTLLFNGNPLLRYDGYHMLSDWLELPNLQGKSSQMALYWVQRYLFGLPTVTSPAESKTESWWLTVYFVASFCYRTAMMIGILIVVSLHYMVLGMVLAVAFGFMWVVLPVLKAIGYLWSSPQLETCRVRACVASALIVGGILAFLCLVPLPNHFRADGVVRAEPFSRVYSGADGVIQKVLVTSGSMVEAGTPLLQMDNPELPHYVEMLDGEQRHADVQARLALEEDPVQYGAMPPYFKALAVRREKLKADAASLTVRAPCAGRWLAPDLGLYVGAVVPRGLELGVVQGEGSFSVSAVVKQDDVSRLFTTQQVKETEVRVRGQEGLVVPVTQFTALPAERESLPSAALGILGGGTENVEARRPNEARTLPGKGLVEAEKGKGTHATEPVFEIRAVLGAHPQVNLTHGERAVARMTLPSEPLMSQWMRQVRQLFQRNYQL